MNDLLAPVRSPGSDRLLLPASATDGTRWTLADRLELRIGLWLLLRSARRRQRRRERDGHYSAHARILLHERSRLDREHCALRAYALNSVRT